MSIIEIDIKRISPYVRFVNNYAPTWSYEEDERIIYDFELMYIAEGFVDLWYDGEHFRLEQDDIFCLSPGVKNHIRVDKDAGFRTHCIHFDYFPPDGKNDFTVEDAYIQHSFSEKQIEFLKNRPIYVPQNLNIPKLIKHTPPEIGELFSQCCYCFLQSTDISIILLKALFMRLIAKICELCNGENAEILYIHPTIQKAAEYIQKHFSESITVANLSKRFGLSDKYFGTLFKRGMGRNVNRFLCETRLIAARDLLIRTDLTIEEIAYKTGFTSVHYFSRCFSEAEKMPPGKYRKLYTA